MNFQNILVVCVGNICRSPTGERLLQGYLKHKQQVSSAGVGALIGSAADAQAEAVAARHGVSLAGHCARQLTAELCDANDLILVMEQAHIGAVDKISPSSRSKVMLFGQWLPKQDIADPYRQSDDMFRLIYRQIDEAARLWADKLNRTR
ncbi:protein tyrosine phosphatase [Neisseria shayeganii]|uniref:protein-tyrosine-phosphatase n=1 Tax=Neisseria shayeganii TaxID=607712 RepID=A0A7D7SR00_9NEIS|nr:protein tyrosine phosphatase [Neisseria shayeganii]QMT41470.1 protein tyrosine phosphatase [Neisseria shayeganii]